ncbi:MAG: hypothetical protein J3R72DRAFT_162993 [Linnemannia gamsii]|nr:MAG: hypothetical protein J3R72DRAFT_162993 [Linnemannia gamsii]
MARRLDSIMVDTSPLTLPFKRLPITMVDPDGSRLLRSWSIGFRTLSGREMQDMFQHKWFLSFPPPTFLSFMLAYAALPSIFSIMIYVFLHCYYCSTSFSSIRPVPFLPFSLLNAKFPLLQNTTPSAVLAHTHSFLELKNTQTQHYLDKQTILFS